MNPWLAIGSWSEAGQGGRTGREGAVERLPEPSWSHPLTLPPFSGLRLGALK